MKGQGINKLHLDCLPGCLDALATEPFVCFVVFLGQMMAGGLAKSTAKLLKLFFSDILAKVLDKDICEFLGLVPHLVNSLFL